MMDMTRNEFRKAVLARDGGLCVICRLPAADAHHIMERRLFSGGGYDIDNGAALCPEHHLAAERTDLSCNEIRAKAGIARIVLPTHLYEDYAYDKWGNIVNPDGTRLKGELFHDHSVQIALAGFLDLFLPYVKHPRTHHLPWSNPDDDDRTIESLDGFVGQDVVATVKMDGEQSSAYRDRFHCRSIEPATGEDRSRVKAIWGSIAHDIPEGWRICGENMYIKHSIHCQHLTSWFYVFGVWDDSNQCLSWDDTREWCDLLGLCTVPELYRGEWNPDVIKALPQPAYGGDDMEGIVVRVTRSFSYGEHRKVVAKHVRPGHVTSERHWRHQRRVANEIG